MKTYTGTKTVFFGELMLRLSPRGAARLVQATGFDAVYGGSEANSAALMAQLGGNTGYAGCLPAGALGDGAVMYLRGFGIDTSKAVRTEGRMGIYFLEKGAAQRPSAVIYDRAGSAMACADPDIYDWDSILADASRFHFSGITPAISAGAARACADALAAAKRLGVKVSCDINYRARLWSTALAAETLAPMLGGIDLLISNESTVRELFGITGVGTAETAENVRRFFGCNSVALTVRRSERDGGELFGGALLRGERFEESPMYRVGGIDRVGAGDAFGGALLYAAEQGADTARAIRFAAAAGCLKHTIEGDAAYLTTDEINVLAEGSADARIRR